jgi:hypothetical protein
MTRFRSGAAGIAALHQIKIFVMGCRHGTFAWAISK